MNLGAAKAAPILSLSQRGALTAPSSEGAFEKGKIIEKSLPLTREVARLRRVGRRDI